MDGNVIDSAKNENVERFLYASCSCVYPDLEKDFSNFRFHLVLSDALPEDNWIEKKDLDDEHGDGFSGFVHQVVIDKFLTNHESPEDIEVYFCGPPLMNKAVLKMCDDWGIPDENVDCLFLQVT